MGKTAAPAYRRVGNAAGVMVDALRLFVDGIPGVSCAEGSVFGKPGVYGITFIYRDPQFEDSDVPETDCFLEFKEGGPDAGSGSLVAYAGGYANFLPAAVKLHISDKYPGQYSEQKAGSSRDGFHCWDSVKREDLLQPLGASAPVGEG